MSFSASFSTATGTVFYIGAIFRLQIVEISTTALLCGSRKLMPDGSGGEIRFLAERKGFAPRRGVDLNSRPVTENSEATPLPDQPAGSNEKLAPLRTTWP